MINVRQTHQYAQYMQSLGWRSFKYPNKKSKAYIYIKKIPLIGNIAKLQRPDISVSDNQIRNFTTSKNISIFYLEPNQIDIHSKILKDSPNLFLPSRTIVLDLKKSYSQLLKLMKPKTRYNIKKARANLIKIEHSTNIELFVRLWSESAIKRFALPQNKEIKALWESFFHNRNLFIAYKNENLLAGLLTINSPDTAYYMYAGSNEIGKKMFAPTILTWEAIKCAKRNGLNYFDFEGIYDERYPQTKPWKGFSKFKEGFGGIEIEHQKTLVYHKNPLLRFLNI